MKRTGRNGSRTSRFRLARAGTAPQETPRSWPESVTSTRPAGTRLSRDPESSMDNARRRYEDVLLPYWRVVRKRRPLQLAAAAGRSKEVLDPGEGQCGSCCCRPQYRASEQAASADRRDRRRRACLELTKRYLFTATFACRANERGELSAAGSRAFTKPDAGPSETTDAATQPPSAGLWTETQVRRSDQPKATASRPPPAKDISALVSVVIESSVACSAAISATLASATWQRVASMVESSKGVMLMDRLRVRYRCMGCLSISSI